MVDAVKQALDAVHASLDGNNVGLDEKIAGLKQALADKGEKQVLMDPTRLPQNNRQGRKMLQTYFKKRGVVVVYKEASERSSASQP
ncbi:MAG: hypothetical protein ACKVOE_01700 [Rickettsiales bacterium]